MPRSLMADGGGWCRRLSHPGSGLHQDMRSRGKATTKTSPVSAHPLVATLEPLPRCLSHSASASLSQLPTHLRPSPILSSTSCIRFLSVLSCILYACASFTLVLISRTWPAAWHFISILIINPPGGFILLLSSPVLIPASAARPLTARLLPWSLP